MRERLDRLWLQEDKARGYAEMLKTCDGLEAIVAETEPGAARTLAHEHDEDGAMPAIAEALSRSEKGARVRLLHYEYLTWR
ncbi:hypothetical protein ACFQ7A_03345 [Streptomyces sp. NPDC056528]|uniref:hypothetical protein n=1 Tax=Streptomyces sp. NPDC056528 TaxID=3345854 RepID=UPI0036A94D4E